MGRRIRDPLSGGAGTPNILDADKGITHVPEAKMNLLDVLRLVPMEDSLTPPFAR